MIFLHILSAAQVNAVLVELIDQYGFINVVDALDGWTPNCQEDIDVLKRELSKDVSNQIQNTRTTTDHHHSKQWDAGISHAV